MAYYDENGKITIDEDAANADIRRIESALGSLQNSKKSLVVLMNQAGEGQGQTTAAAAEKSAELIGKINDLVSRLNETKSFIQRTVAHYRQVDMQLKVMIMSEGGAE